MSDYNRHGARYRARRRAVDILFEAETRDVDPVAIVEDRIALAEDPANAVAPVAEYTREIISGAAESLDEIDEAIARFLSEDWELNRLPAVDRAILPVAAWEILYNPDVAPSIVISNAMEMSVEYAGDKASPYIHAVLDDIIQAHSVEAPDIITGETGLIGFTEEDAEAASTEEAIDSEASAELEPGFDTDQEAAQEQE